MEQTATRQQDIDKASEIFKALSHPLRLKIACLLREEGEQTQKQLIDELGLPQSSVARYLEPLRQVGLVEGHRQGQEVMLGIKGELLGQMLGLMCSWFHDETDMNAERAGESESPKVNDARMEGV